jgi:hypothetical protein
LSHRSDARNIQVSGLTRHARRRSLDPSARESRRCATATRLASSWQASTERLAEGRRFLRGGTARPGQLEADGITEEVNEVVSIESSSPQNPTAPSEIPHSTNALPSSIVSTDLTSVTPSSSDCGDFIIDAPAENRDSPSDIRAHVGSMHSITHRHSTTRALTLPPSGGCCHPSSAVVKIAVKADVWHPVQRGIVMQLHFDLERAWLRAGHGPITDYAAATGDIAGNLVHTEVVKIRLPDRYLPAPE